MGIGLRIAGCIACLIVAAYCFGNGGALGLPQWAWSVIGVSWLLNALGMLFSGRAA